MDVKLLAWLPGGEEILAAGASSTRSGRDAYETMRNFDPNLRAFIDYAVRLHLSSVMDFPYAIVTFSDVSRVFTHQLVRHRLAAYMQQSMRFVRIPLRREKRYVPWYVVPPSVAEGDPVPFLVANERAGEAYRRLMEAGVPTEDARFILPNGVKTHITMAADAEEWMHVIRMRAHPHAQWEIRRAALATLFALSVVYPDLFGRIRANKWERTAIVRPKDAPPWVYRALLGKDQGKIAAEIEERGEYVLEEDGKRYVLNEENTEIQWISGVYMLKEARILAKMGRRLSREWDGKEELVMDLTDLLGTRVEEEKKEEAGRRLGKELGEDIEWVDLDHRVLVRIAPQGLCTQSR